MFWEPAAPIQNRVQRRVKRRRAALIISLVFDFSLLFLFTSCPQPHHSVRSARRSTAETCSHKRQTARTRGASLSRRGNNPPGIFIPVSAGFYVIVSDRSRQVPQFCLTGGQSCILRSGRTLFCSAAYFFCCGQLWDQQIYVPGRMILQGRNLPLFDIFCIIFASKLHHSCIITSFHLYLISAFCFCLSIGILRRAL